MRKSGGTGLKGDHGGVRATSRGGSMPQNTSTGSGSRPGGGRTTTDTSAPRDPKTLGRATPSALK